MIRESDGTGRAAGEPGLSAWTNGLSAAIAMATVLIPLPRRDGDPSEVAVSWQILRNDGHVVVFATPDGQPARADELMLSGIGLDP